MRISGVCLSACTILLGYVPRKNICMTDKGVLGFHLATMEFATRQLMEVYPDYIKAWIAKRGGLTYQVHEEMLGSPRPTNFSKSARPSLDPGSTPAVRCVLQPTAAP